jgi:peptidoglycan hydrolase-like protein with peptidoglycan-binding domain
MSKAALPERAARPTRTSQFCAAGPQPASPVTLRRAVQTSVRPSQVPPVHEVVQPKLAIGAIDDPLEHEADRVADHVMRMPDRALSIGAGGRQISRTCAASAAAEQQKPQLKQETSRVADQVMRKEGGPPGMMTSAPPVSGCCAACERQEPIAGGGAAHGSDHGSADHVAEAVGRGGAAAAFTLSSQTPALRRKCAGCEGEEEKKLQTKPAGVAAPAASPAPSLVHDALRASGRPLDHSTRAFMEPRFGHEFSHVRVHTDGLASRSAEAVAARAYTVGSNIAFRSGEYAPDTVAGRSLLAHELAHVVQQGAARPAMLRRVHADAAGRKQFDSPDYAGDPKLEACLNDEDRLRPGDRSATVAKVQSGLLKDGADLGPTGADGSYGPHTAQAVIAFKQKYQLGFEQFADVGPGTMAQLDALGTSPGPTPPPSPTPSQTATLTTQCGSGPNAGTVVVTGSGFPPGRVDLAVDGTAANSALADADGNVAGSVPSSLKDGSHVVQAQGGSAHAAALFSTPCGVVPPPRPAQPHDGVDVEQLPILASAGSAAKQAKQFARSGAKQAQVAESGAKQAKQVAGPALAFAVSPVGDAPAPKPLAIPFHGSVEQSVYLVARWLNPSDDRRAAAAAARLVADKDTTYSIPDKSAPVALAEYETFAKTTGSVKLNAGSVTFLCRDMQITRAQFEAALDTQKKYGEILTTAEQAAFFGQFGPPLDPQGTAAESRQAEAKRIPFTSANDKVLENPQVAQLYLAILDKYAKPSLDPEQLRRLVQNGLDEAGLKQIIAGDMRRRLITNFFTQGVVEYRGAQGSDLPGQFFRLEDSLLAQLTWGNPTVVRNELMVGVGSPERQLGLVFRLDGTLYYNSNGEPLHSFAGGGFRDPGFRGAARDPGIIDIDAIKDPVIRGFFKLLHDQFKTPALIVAKGTEAYWNNNEEVNRRVSSKLPAEILEHMEDALVFVAGFLVWRSAAMAFMRSTIPPLQAVGAGMEVMAEAFGYLLDIQLLGSLEATLLGAGYELSHVTPKDPNGSYDAASDYHMDQAAAIIRPVIADIVTQLILAGVAKGLTKTKAIEKARAKMVAIKNGERARIECTFCHVVQEAAEFSKEVGRDYYEGAATPQEAKFGAVLRSPKPEYRSVEIHPDGNIYGEHKALLKYIKEAGISRSGTSGLAFESHHLIEDNQMELFGVDREKGRCVALEQSDHQTFSAWMRGLLNRKTALDIDELYELHSQMYQDNGHPEYVAQMRIFLRESKDAIRSLYDKGKVPTGKWLDFPARRARVQRFLDSL